MVVQYNQRENILQEYLRALRQKYNSSTVEQSDNIFLISKYRSAIQAKPQSRLSQVELDKKLIVKENTNFHHQPVSKGINTSVDESYFNMSHSLFPKNLDASNEYFYTLLKDSNAELIQDPDMLKFANVEPVMRWGEILHFEVLENEDKPKRNEKAPSIVDREARKAGSDYKKN